MNLSTFTSLGDRISGVMVSALASIVVARGFDFSGVRATRSFVLCVCIVARSLPFCTFSFGHCVAVPAPLVAPAALI
jgi:hypothetical protein